MNRSLKLFLSFLFLFEYGIFIGLTTKNSYYELLISPLFFCIGGLIGYSLIKLFKENK